MTMIYTLEVIALCAILFAGLVALSVGLGKTAEFLFKQKEQHYETR